MAGENSRRTLVFGWPPCWGPDHEAIIRFGGKAPRRQAHSNGSMTMFWLGSCDLLIYASEKGFDPVIGLGGRCGPHAPVQTAVFSP
jgi:hypothetical protein